MKNIRAKLSLEIVKKVFLSFCLLIAFSSFFIFYKMRIVQTISPQFDHHLKKIIGTVFVLIIALFLQNILSATLSWYRKNIALKTETTLDDELIPLFRRVVIIIVWTIALLIILPIYGINISALVAALGVASLAIALAAQDTIANIIAGFLIMIDRPFKVGDKIKIPSGEVVKVLNIGVRRSRFLSEDKAIIIVPNLDLSKSKIVNYTYGEKDEF